MFSVITVENLGKKYLLKHQSGQQPYVALRDVLSDGVKSLGSRLFGRNTLLSRSEELEEFWALKDVSFEVKQGDRIGIIGRNGAGKSTLLKILSRITEPTTGSVRIKGRVASLLEVGTGFHPELTGRENIYLNGAILGMSRVEIRQKFDEIVEFAEIEKFLDTPVKRFSSGMYVRLAFAVAAHLEPEILVVDEVLAVGDAQFQKKCLGKMEDVSAREGRTVLFVSHNMGAIQNLCNRTILFDKGTIVSDALTDESLQLYRKLARDIKVDASTGIHNERVRRGSGAVRFSSVEILDADDEIRTSFGMGESIRFRMTYKVFAEMKGIAIYIGLRSGLTREFTTSVKHIVTLEAVAPGSRGEIVIDLPDVVIRPGEYPLYFHLSDAEMTDMSIDVLDDLTAPLVITASDNITYDNYDQTRPIGYFSLLSRLHYSNISG